MSGRSGLLVINRLELMRRGLQAGVLSKRSPAVRLSTEAVFRRYRGFDGLPWPVMQAVFQTEHGLAAINDLSLVVQYMGKLPHADECDLILLGPSGSTAPREELGWSPARFDVGYFESEWSHFSVILNEVLFGVHDELRSFASRLNEHLLVETFEESWTLFKDRNRLARLGADLEQAGRLEPIPVFLPYAA
jgi:hypothetical protein